MWKMQRGRNSTWRFLALGPRQLEHPTDRRKNQRAGQQGRSLRAIRSRCWPISWRIARCRWSSRCDCTHGLQCSPLVESSRNPRTCRERWSWRRRPLANELHEQPNKHQHDQLQKFSPRFQLYIFFHKFTNQKQKHKQTNWNRKQFHKSNQNSRHFSQQHQRNRLVFVQFFR